MNINCSSAIPFVATILLLLSNGMATAQTPVRVLVWDEQQPEQKQAYGDKFLGETIAASLQNRPGLSVKSSALRNTDQGLSQTLLDQTDVLIVWSHVRVREQNDDIMEAVVKRVQQGQLSLIALHSAHWHKVFVRLMQERTKTDALQQIPETQRASAKWDYVNASPYGKGVKADDRLTPFLETGTDGVFKLTLPQCVFPAWRPDGAASHVTTRLPDHPIAAGLPATWDIPHTEMYGEPFHVPEPDAVIFEERWDKGEFFRSGCLWKIGKGHVFYFRPGHEIFPVFLQAEPLRVLENAARWLPTAATE